MPPLPRRRRRIGRIALNALTGVSLVLCAGTLSLWARSCFCLDKLIWITRDGRMWAIESGNGSLLVGTVSGFPIGAPLRWLRDPRRLDPAGLPLLLSNGATLSLVPPRSHGGLALIPLLRTGQQSPRPWLDQTRFDDADAVIVTIGPHPYRQSIVPHAVASLVTGVLPAAWCVRRLRRAAARRAVRTCRERNLCTHCRYQLAGNVSGTCPEMFSQ